MEAVPRLPMVCFELKTPTENTSFGPKLKEYIRDFYNEDGETYNLEIGQLEALRAAAVRPGRDVSGVANLKRYYCQLHFLMSRFPMVKDGAAAVQFSWRDVYVGMSFSVADIRYEISSVLYNIGALHTQLGMSDTRTTEDGMKMACTHFQCSAWAFQHLKDTYPPSTEADIAPDIMQFAYHLCLAQAQECILEKSMMDNRKASIIVKVAVQVVNYYSQAFNALKQSVSEEAVGTKIYTGWRRLAKFKEIYYRCVIQLFQGMQAEEQQKMGERVSFYQLAHDTLEEAIKLSKNLDKGEMNPKQVQEALSFTQDVVEGKRKAAKNENEFIYHEEVPDRDQLPKAMGVSLVKGIPFSVNDAEVSGPDIFGRLVPMKAHEASSLYSEEKAKLLRKVGGSIEEKDQLLTAFLSSLQLDYLHCYSEPNQLPQELVDRCAALSAKPNAIQSLTESMSKLSDVWIEVETMLQEIKTMLEEEETLEKEYQAIMGKRPPSIVATDMTREAKKYLEAHTRANESNQALHKVMSTHISNLRILSLPLSQVQQQIPPPPALSDPDSESIVKEMQILMEKVEEMKNQRAMLTTQLRDSICKDDITQILVTQHNETLDTLFQEELKKHQDIVKLIQQNLSAQDNILKAVTDAYARYSNVRKATAEAVRKRQSVINALISCFDAYEDLLAKSAKGHEFYNILETNVSKLLGRVRSTCRVQREEREQMLTKNNTALPSKVPNKFANVLDNSANAPKAYSGPKLKDYLKADGGINLPSRGSGSYLNSDLGPTVYSGPGLYNQLPASTSGQSTPYYDSSAGAGVPKASTDKPLNWMPGIRPAPLGSEATSSVLKSEPTDLKTVPYIPQTPYPQPMYNYAGAWGYGSQASTMSTYLPTDVQYSVESKPSDNFEATHQLSTIGVDHGHRYTPVGGASYQSGFSEASQSHNPLAAGGYKTQPNQVPSSGNQPVGSASPAYQTQTSYESYHPTIAAASGQHYNLQNPSYYAGGATAYQNASGYSVSSDQVGASGYGNMTSGVQSTNSSQYSNHLTPSVGCYDQQVPSNYQNVSNVSNLAASSISQPVSHYSTASPASHIQQSYPNPSVSPASHLQSSYPDPSASPASHLQQNYPNPSVSPAVHVQSHFANPTASPANNLQSSYLNAGNMATTPANQSMGNYPNQTASPASQSLPNYQNLNGSSTSSGTQPNYQNAASAGQTHMYSYEPQWPSSVQTSYTNYQFPAADSTHHFQYMQNQNTSSYSSAGAYPTNQTSSSYSTISQSHDYNTSSSSSSGHYYQIPPYGAQNPGTINPTTCVVQSSSVGVEQNYSTQGMYMQSRMPNSDSYTTDSPKTAKSSSAEGTSSNIDLLAELDLDFSVNQQPLVPQQGEMPPSVVQTTVDDSDLSALIDSMSDIQMPDDLSVKSLIQKQTPKDPFQDKEHLQQFTQEVEKYEKFVEGLTLKTLNGPTTLDMKWKEIVELQEKDSHRRSISVARCYPMKNRFPDILPFDCSRVELPSTKDDYINASHLKDLTLSTPPFILTQLPLPSTFNDFWIMVNVQQVEVVVCLLSDMELEGQRYWPAEKNQEMSVGRMRLNLQTANVKPHWTERIISVYDTETRASRVVVHLQFTAWPGSSFPSSPGPFLSFVSECLTFHSQQRNVSHPVVVHCLSGVGRTGLFCLTAATICEVQAGHGLIDLVTLTVAMSERRKAALRDREHLKFAYLSLLYYAQDILMKCGILTSGSSFEDKRSRTEGKCHTRHPSQDFLLGPPTGLSQLQSGIEKMGCSKPQ